MSNSVSNFINNHLGMIFILVLIIYAVRWVYYRKKKKKVTSILKTGGNTPLNYNDLPEEVKKALCNGEKVKFEDLPKEIRETISNGKELKYSTQVKYDVDLDKISKDALPASTDIEKAADNNEADNTATATTTEDNPIIMDRHSKRRF